MNYFNPYYMMSHMVSAARPGLFSALRGATSGGLTLSNIVNGTQKTLGIINQAIPIVKQVTPVMRNAKTMFKVMNEFKKVETPSTPNTEEKQNVSSSTNAGVSETVAEKTETMDGGPTFFA